eukprot:7187108-Pyramimonas_sp.AAC.1
MMMMLMTMMMMLMMGWSTSEGRDDTPRSDSPDPTAPLQWRPMPRNTLLASRVPWASWVSMDVLWKAWRSRANRRPGVSVLGCAWKVSCGRAPQNNLEGCPVTLFACATDSKPR